MEQTKKKGKLIYWLLGIIFVCFLFILNAVMSASNVASNGTQENGTASNENTNSVSAPSAPASNSGSSDPATNLSEQFGVSLSDAQTIESIVSRRFSNQDIQQAVATDAAKLDTAGIGDATAITNDLSDIVQGWGFANANDASVAVNDLYTASQSSAYNFNDFSSIIIQATPNLLAAGISFQSSVNTLAAFSTQAGETASTAQQTYLAVASDMNPVNAKGYNAIMQISGVPQDLHNKDFAGVLTDMEKYFANNPQ
jgi:hypothetical protein